MATLPNAATNEEMHGSLFFLAQWIKRPPGVWKVTVPIPVRDSKSFSLSHACDMMNITSFSFI